MKKISFMLAIGIITIFPLCAQDTQMEAKVTKVERLQNLIPVNDPLPADNKNLINIKAIRDFSKTFKTVTNEDWYVIQNGFMAKFKNQDIQHRVIYNKRGNWVATFRYYNEGQLCSEVRNLIKSVWYDAAITDITEVNFGGKTAYLVNTQDKKSIKTIKVVNNEMEICREIITTAQNP